MPVKFQHVEASDLTVGDLLLWMDDEFPADLPSFEDIVESEKGQLSRPFKVVLALHSNDLIYHDSNFLPSVCTSIDQVLAAMSNAQDALTNFKVYNVSVITDFSRASRTIDMLDAPDGQYTVHQLQWFAARDKFKDTFALNRMILFTVTFE